MKFNRILLVVFLVMILSGCKYVQSNIAVFHELTLDKSQMKYSFLPLNGQKGNLEYKSYKKIVAEKLSAYGFVEVQENPEYFIAFAYGIDNGKEEISSIPIVGQTGVSSATTYGSINTYGNYGSYSGTTTYQPTYGVVGSAPVSNTVYTRKLELSIIDINNSKPDEPSVIYQANVVSAGSSAQVAAVMPYMLEALFKKFPDESGKTRRERTPMK